MADALTLTPDPPSQGAPLKLVPDAPKPSTLKLVPDPALTPQNIDAMIAGAPNDAARDAIADRFEKQQHIGQWAPPPKIIPPQMPPKPVAAQTPTTLVPDAKPVTPAKPGFLDEAGADIHRRGKEAVGDLKRDISAPPSLMDMAASVVPGVGVLGTKLGEDALKYITAGPSGLAEAAVKPTIKATQPYTAPLANKLSSMTGGVLPKAASPEQASRSVGDITGAMALPAGGESRTAGAVGDAVRGAKEFLTGNKLVRATKEVFNPTGMSEAAGQTERVIRGARGRGDIETERAAHQLLQDNRIVANAPVVHQRQLVDYIENRSSGAQLPPNLKKFQATADRVADVADKVRARAEATMRPEDLPEWRQDYYAHMWKETPAEVEQRMQMYAKQGSSGAFKKRTIPTISDGIKAGLTPRFENPIENTIRYSTSINRYIGTHDILNQLEDLGHVKWAHVGDQPSGWVPLNGIMTQKAVPIARGEEPGASMIRRYAPPEVARVYNNHISKGVEQGDWGPVWTFARRAANTMTMAKLGLSAYHGTTMSLESIISDVARGFKDISSVPGKAIRGSFKEAGAALGRGVKSVGGAVVAPIRTTIRGARMGNQLLGKTAAPTPMDAKINDLFVKSGGRLRMDRLYNSSGSGSFLSAIQHGSFLRELKDAASNILEKPISGTAELAGRIVQTVSAPLFEKYIPALKRGAFASTLEDWLKANPGASEDETVRYATQLQDSIDNRFGELVQDNLFWNKTFKQMNQLLLLSSTWDIGTVREIGGGIADLAKSGKGIVSGKGITDRTAYVAALAAVTGVINGMYTYLKTGTMPHGKDFMAARTGGTVPRSTQPERAMTPGYQKDVYAFGYNFPHNIGNELANKANPLISFGADYLANKDYRGLPIYPGQGVRTMPGDQGVGDDLIERFMPISIDQFRQGMKKGSNIGMVERGLGIRPAPAYIQDPTKLQRTQQHFAQKDWQAKQRADRRQKQQQQP